MRTEARSNRGEEEHDGQQDRGQDVVVASLVCVSSFFEGSVRLVR